jgi:hypothetical protein
MNGIILPVIHTTTQTIQTAILLIPLILVEDQETQIIRAGIT